MPQNLPIENELKIKRVYQTEPVNTASWAYMRALRQLGGTKKVYPVNPYVEVYQLQPNVYGLLTENADGMGDPWMYLVVGPERAMLIDTGHFATDLDNVTVDAMPEACGAICADPVGSASYRVEGPRGVQLFRYVEGLGTIVYSERNV